MAVKTVEEYVESLRKLKPTAYMFGEKIENVVDNPRIRGGINSTGATYELAHSEKYRPLDDYLIPKADWALHRAEHLESIKIRGRWLDREIVRVGRR